MKFMMQLFHQQEYILTIVQSTIQTKDEKIIGFSERIIASVLKSFIDSALDVHVAHKDKLAARHGKKKGKDQYVNINSELDYDN
jgi:hypothetical protein